MFLRELCFLLDFAHNPEYSLIVIGPAHDLDPGRHAPAALLAGKGPPLCYIVEHGGVLALRGECQGHWH
jgi:hypothetical protein